MKTIQKPWGHEIVWASNDMYTGKFLYILANQETSKQYHREKHETIFLAKGKAKVLLNGIEKEFDASIDKEDDRIFVVPPHTIHKLIAITDCEFIEVSTSQLEEDVIRINDIYHRIE